MSSLMKNEIIKGRGEEIKFPFTLSLSPICQKCPAGGQRRRIF